LLGGPISLSS